MNAVAAGADAIGVNFFHGSPRACSAEQAADIVRVVPPGFPVYGVFVSAGRARIQEVVRATGVNGIQLHGGEDREEALGWDLPVIRAVNVSSREQAEALVEDRETYRLLLDSPLGGGSGVRIEEGLLDGLDLGEVLLAGGLDPGNVGAVVRRLRPGGVDCASGVEIAAGVKDPSLIKEFVVNARST